jgi:hypothetical protein
VPCRTAHGVCLLRNRGTLLHNRAVSFFKGLQDRICTALEHLDGGSVFRTDSWERPGGGGGRSRVTENGNVIEKGGVNFSEVFGEFSPEFAKQIPGDGAQFTATGISLVRPSTPISAISRMARKRGLAAAPISLLTTPSKRTWSTSTKSGNVSATSILQLRVTPG